MAGALKEGLLALRGPRTKAELARWIRQRYRNRWKPGTLIGHLYGGRANHPLAFKHHPGQKKFLFERRDGRYELYDASKHGDFRNGLSVTDASVPSWIIVHSQSRYQGYDYDSPQTELAQEFQPGIHWHWKMRRPMKEDERPRTILLGWDQAVFGEATATITRKIDREYLKHFNFAFVLLSYRPLSAAIPFSALRLGARAHQHRGLIRLDAAILERYRAIRCGIFDISSDPIAIPEGSQIEANIQTATNPHKAGGQGFGLSAKERKCVELHAMEVARRFLVKNGYAVNNVSSQESFDFLASKDGESVVVEVKGCVGDGAKIQLTKNEVALQRLEHPNNMLILVHSIQLHRDGATPTALGGELQMFRPGKSPTTNCTQSLTRIQSDPAPANYAANFACGSAVLLHQAVFAS